MNGFFMELILIYQTSLTSVFFWQILNDTFSINKKKQTIIKKKLTKSEKFVARSFKFNFL